LPDTVLTDKLTYIQIHTCLTYDLQITLGAYESRRHYQQFVNVIVFTDFKFHD